MTAAFIGQQLKFGRGPSLFATEASKEGKLTWKDIDDQKVATTNEPEEVFKLSRKHMLCINGDILQTVILLPNAATFVR